MSDALTVAQIMSSAVGVMGALVAGLSVDKSDPEAYCATIMRNVEGKALESTDGAGCQEASVLEHSRSGAPHVRGCWVVDLVLGRE